LKQIEILERTPGNDKQIRAIGNELLKLTNDRKHVNEDASSWKETVIAPVKFSLTVEEYIRFVREGLPEKVLAHRLRTSLATLQRWKISNNINKHEIKRKLKLEEAK